MSGKERKPARGRDGARAWLPRVTGVMVVVVALFFAASYLQMRDIERGLLSVVADQQDGYVELVVGQINLRDNRDDAEVIDDILGVLDESASRYWAFSRDSTMLFVRDVTETNRYKGLPSGSYFDDAAAQEFYDGLSTDRVSHAYVTLDGDEYIASGQAYRYKKGTYRLVLLTNESVVLDNNQLLGARSRLSALLGLEAALLLFAAIWLSAGRDRKSRALDEARGQLSELAAKLDRVNERISRERAFDTGARVWAHEALPDFEASLSSRGKSAWLARVRCESPEAAAAVLARSKVLFGEDVVRFYGDGQGVGEQAGASRESAPSASHDAGSTLLLLFLGAGRERARELAGEALGGTRAEVTWTEVGKTASGGDDEQEKA